MNPRTKKKVKNTRHAQLFLRACELLGALGLLFCIICIKGTQGSTGWIIRVPVCWFSLAGSVALIVNQAGVAILHTIYAIYHLARSSNARTPASSASYMIFAAILDAGLIPFLVITAIMAHDQFLEPSDTPGHWASLLMYTTATTKIIETTYLVSIVNGTLHLISLMISIYLAVLFRKISNLPPDMNPLEDNLTSRHKRNKSELVDNRTSQGSTTISSKRESRVDEPLISPVRSVPFMHTRNESSVNLNNVPYPHFSPRASRTNVSAPLYDQPLSHRSSRTNTRHSTFYSQSPTHQVSQTNLKPLPLSTDHYSYTNTMSPPPEETTLLRPPTKSSSVYTDDIASRPTSTRPTSTCPPSTLPFSTAPSLPPPSEYSDTKSNDDSNWITHPSPVPSPPIEFKHLRNSNPYQPLPQTSPYENIENRTAKPLEMNPPTPVNARFDIQQGRRDVRAATIIDQRALMPGTGNTLGLRGQPLDFNPPRRKEVQRTGVYRDVVGTGRMGGGNAYGNGVERKSRVVSRSGVEYADGSQGFPSGMRAREVSGKLVEEGRGGLGRGWGSVR